MALYLDGSVAVDRFRARTSAHFLTSINSGESAPPRIRSRLDSRASAHRQTTTSRRSRLRGTGRR